MIETGQIKGDPNEIDLDVIDVKTKAVRASGKMKTTWGTIKI